MLTESEVLERALELPAPQRAAIIERLLESLEPDETEQRRLDEAWGKELERRSAAYDRGEVQSIDAREAIARIREEIKQRRTS